MLNFQDIMQTIRMIEKEKLDVRTITMGISLLDCSDEDGKVARQKAYNKITRLAQNLVKVGEEIEIEYGIRLSIKNFGYSDFINCSSL